MLPPPPFDGAGAELGPRSIGVPCCPFPSISLIKARISPPLFSYIVTLHCRTPLSSPLLFSRLKAPQLAVFVAVVFPPIGADAERPFFSFIQARATRSMPTSFCGHGVILNLFPFLQRMGVAKRITPCRRRFGHFVLLSLLLLFSRRGVHGQRLSIDMPFASPSFLLPHSLRQPRRPPFLGTFD